MRKPLYFSDLFCFRYRIRSDPTTPNASSMNALPNTTTRIQAGWPDVPDWQRFLWRMGVREDREPARGERNWTAILPERTAMAWANLNGDGFEAILDSEHLRATGKPRERR